MNVMCVLFHSKHNFYVFENDMRSILCTKCALARILHGQFSFVLAFPLDTFKVALKQGCV